MLGGKALQFRRYYREQLGSPALSYSGGSGPHNTTKDSHGSDDACLMEWAGRYHECNDGILCDLHTLLRAAGGVSSPWCFKEFWFQSFGHGRTFDSGKQPDAASSVSPASTTATMLSLIPRSSPYAASSATPASTSATKLPLDSRKLTIRSLVGHTSPDNCHQAFFESRRSPRRSLVGYTSLDNCHQAVFDVQVFAATGPTCPVLQWCGRSNMQYKSAPHSGMQTLLARWSGPAASTMPTISGYQ